MFKEVPTEHLDWAILGPSAYIKSQADKSAPSMLNNKKPYDASSNLTETTFNSSNPHLAQSASTDSKLARSQATKQPTPASADHPTSHKPSNNMSNTSRKVHLAASLQSLNYGHQLLLLRGIRVRMGIASGANAADVSTSPADGRTRYGGRLLATARALCYAASGGMVLLSDDAQAQLPQDLVAKDAAVLDMGVHDLTSPAVHTYAAGLDAPTNSLPYGKVVIDILDDDVDSRISPVTNLTQQCLNIQLDPKQVSATAGSATATATAQGNRAPADTTAVHITAHATASCCSYEAASALHSGPNVSLQTALWGTSLVAGSGTSSKDDTHTRPSSCCDTSGVTATGTGSMRGSGGGHASRGIPPSLQVFQIVGNDLALR